MYCSNCGSPIKETDIFCSKCGHKQGSESKAKESPKEEVIFNTPSQKENGISFAEDESPWDNWDNNERKRERKSEPVFRAPNEAHESVNNARKPEVEDFVWNVHDFPEPGAKPVEDIDFSWDEEVQPRSERFTRPITPPREEFEGDSKFHTYNKTREEFQELLDKEYIRQKREPEYPLQRGPQEQPSYDSPDHIGIIEKPQRESSEYYKPWEHIKSEEFDIEKTQFFQKQELETPPQELETPPIIPADTRRAPSIPPEHTDFHEPSPIAEVMDNLHLGENAMTEPAMVEPEMTAPEMTSPESVEDFSELNNAKEEDSVKTDDVDIDKAQALAAAAVELPTPGIDERLAKLWDSDTAPVPVAYLGLGGKSIGSKKTKLDDSEVGEDLLEGKDSKDPKNAEDFKDIEDPNGREEPPSYDPLNDVYEDEDAKDGRKGGFFGKFIIAIIIIILIIEGSILGLRNFAPESDATAKANQVILTIQNWVEDTFFDKK